MLGPILRAIGYIVAIGTLGLSAFLSGLAIISLLGDNYSGTALPQLGAVSFPTAIFVLVFLVIAAICNRQWPFVAAAIVTLPSLLYSVFRPLEFDVEIFLYRALTSTQTTTILAVLTLLVMRRRALRLSKAENRTTIARATSPRSP